MTSCHQRCWQLAVLLAVCLQTASASQPGPVQGDWLVRAGVAHISPLGMHSTIPGIGGRAEIPDTISPTLDISYFLTDHWALQLAGGVASTPYRLKDSLVGDLDIATVKIASAALMAQYHFFPGERVNPYVGVGVAHSRALDVEPADDIPDFQIASVTSVLLGAGLDYHLGGNWFGNAAVQYIRVPTYHFEGEGFSAEIDMNTLIAGVGLGYRF